MRIQQAFSQTQTQISITSGHEIGVKQNGTNYALWSQVMEMYIVGKNKLEYITGDVSQPESIDSTFQRWRTENVVVKGWHINSIESSLIGNFIRYPTTQQVWDAVAIIYFDGSDTS